MKPISKSKAKPNQNEKGKKLVCCGLVFVIFFFETESHSIAQAGIELTAVAGNASGYRRAWQEASPVAGPVISQGKQEMALGPGERQQWALPSFPTHPATSHALWILQPPEGVLVLGEEADFSWAWWCYSPAI